MTDSGTHIELCRVQAQKKTDNNNKIIEQTFEFN